MVYVLLNDQINKQNRGCRKLKSIVGSHVSCARERIVFPFIAFLAHAHAEERVGLLSPAALWARKSVSSQMGSFLKYFRVRSVPYESLISGGKTDNMFLSSGLGCKTPMRHVWSL